MVVQNARRVKSRDGFSVSDRDDVSEGVSEPLGKWRDGEGVKRDGRAKMPEA